MVEWLFLAAPWGCLRFVIVVFPDLTIFYIWSTFVNLFPKIDYVFFVRLTTTKMTAKMAAACQFALVDTLSHFITRFLSNSIGYMDYFYDNQAGCKHGCPHFTAGHYLGPLFRSPTILVYIIFKFRILQQTSTSDR